MIKNSFLFLLICLTANICYSGLAGAYTYTNSVEIGKDYSKSTQSYEIYPGELEDDTDTKYFGQIPEDSDNNYFQYNPYMQINPYYGSYYTIIRPYYYPVRTNIGSFKYTGHSFNYGTVVKPPIINKPSKPTSPPSSGDGSGGGQGHQGSGKPK